ncbi:MAG TPA: transglycosylase SLT domain-containing protein [Pyrinomonadaceae bacterium]|jgi:membrane-bound lytic murein transglycosylase D
MKTSFPRLISFAAIISILAAPLSTLRAQSLTASPLRNTQSDVERSAGPAQAVMDKADEHFKQGEFYLKDNKFDAARAEFDKSVDAVLESGMDVRANPKLQNFYLQLVERIYRMEVPAQAAQTQAVVASSAAAPALPGGAQIVPATAANDVASVQQPTGFLRDQHFEPSPLDELSKIVLTEEEKTVTDEEVAKLEEVKSTINFGFNSNTLIQQYINYYQGRGRGTMEVGLRRSGRYMTMAREIFRKEGVPEDIVWLGQVESTWKPNAYSWAAASGLWQFIPSTGAQYGLRQTAWIDERNSFEKATHASARYLKWLHDRYNNWELAMAAYNTGEGNVDRAISRAGARDFWRIYPYIAQETRNYVPNILATILIAKNPERYGFRNIRPEPPLSYDVVNVPSATSLQLVASATDTSVDYLRSLNPELRRDVTPRGEAYNLRVPAGRGKSFVALLKRVPADRRESAKVVSVAPGEDFGSVAARTGSSVAQLQLWNAGVDLSKGGKLVVPSGAVRNVAMVRARPNTTATASTLVTVRAKAGETISQIASRYGADAEEVARLNAYAADAALVANQMVKVPAKSPAATGGAPTRRGR